MVYFKVILNSKRQNESNLYPVAIRITTTNRTNTTFSTGIRIRLEDWDIKSLNVKSTHPNALEYNKTISEFNSKVQNIVYQLIHENEFSFQALKDRLIQNTLVQKKVTKATFQDFANQLIEDMLSINQAGNAIVYRTAINRFIKFTNDPKLKFPDIDYKLLEAFKYSLAREGVKANSISNYFRTLRAIYNKAIKAKIVDRRDYPFLEVTFKTERTAKRAITIEDLTTIAKLPLTPNTRKWHARNYFLLSFTLIGMSFTDLAYLKPSSIRKGRIFYRRRKTGKELSVRTQSLTEALLDNYKDSSNKYLLPVILTGVQEDSFKAKALITQWIKTTNKWLRRIVEDCKLDCDVTTYVARHTWATTAKRLGHSNEMIAEAMGHEYGNRITNIYLDSFDQSVIDEMNEKVIKAIS